jgi:multiple antibiotic resistance protein
MQRLFNEFVTLFVVLDPFSMLPVFLALTGGLDAAQARRLAVRAVLIAGAVLLFFVIAGQALLLGSSTFHEPFEAPRSRDLEGV